MKNYVVLIEGFIHGMFRDIGETLTLTEKQAKTFEREGRIELKDKPKKSAGKTKASEKA